MKFIDFLKDKSLHIVMFLISLLMTIVVLNVLNLNLYTVTFISCLYTVAFIIPLAIEFLRKSRCYNKILDNLKELDQKYLLSEVIEEPYFVEGQILYDTLKICNKDMNDEIAKHKKASNEYREYIEMWVHEVKTPIASSKLIFENNPSDVTKSLEEEMNKIDGYVEQALYYAKSNSVEKDYIIKETSLKELINSTIRKNSKNFIRNRIRIEIFQEDFKVYTDIKWSQFIIEQIINNSVKYMDKTTKILKIQAINNTNNLSLIIEDNGIGIGEKDLVRIFEKGFTGENGRKFSKSTGMGLYLSKKLCHRLGMGIDIVSEIGKGTKVTLIFPKNKLTLLA